MATLNIAKYKAHGQLDAGYKGLVRVLDFPIKLGKDVTMVSATDVINLAKLPGNAVVVAATIQQVTAGTGTGTLAARVGTTAVSGTLVATATAGTAPAATAASLPYIVPTGGEDLNLLGATALRADGDIRVVVVLVEGDRDPRAPGLVARDAIGG